MHPLTICRACFKHSNFFKVKLVAPNGTLGKEHPREFCQRWFCLCQPMHNTVSLTIVKNRTFCRPAFTTTLTVSQNSQIYFLFSQLKVGANICSFGWITSFYFLAAFLAAGFLPPFLAMAAARLALGLTGAFCPAFLAALTALAAKFFLVISSAFFLRTAA